MNQLLVYKTGVLSMPKQQIAADIAESEQDYQQQSSRLVRVSNTVITKTPVDVTDTDNKKSIIKYSDKPLTNIDTTLAHS